MNGAVTHQMMMLRPMQAGISGYARLQGESGRQLIQVNLRGMQCEEMRVFWYAGEGLVREVGRSLTNLRGEATLNAELPAEIAVPRRLMALLITDSGARPRPLAIGLCTAQSAGSLMDAKNALLALCDKLARLEEQSSHTAPIAADAALPGERPDTCEKCPDRCGEKQDGREKRLEKPKTGAASSHGKAYTHAESPEPDGQPVSKRKEKPMSSSGSVMQKERHHRSSPEADLLPREVFLPAIEAKARPERRRFQRETGRTDGRAISRSGTVDPRQCEGKYSIQQSMHGDTQQTAPVSGGTTADVILPTSGEVQDRQITPAVQQTAANQPSAASAYGNRQVASSRQGEPARRLPADRLPCLQWPAAFQPLAAYFDRCLPQRLLDWPGWRFIQVPEGNGTLWIGYRQREDQVQQVAYALPADARPPQGQPFQPVRAADGRPLQVLVLNP